MSTSENSTCQRCGAVVPANSVDDLCPACLMSGALGANDEKTLTVVADQAPPQAVSEVFPRNFGEYRLLGLLGSGGMGTVYEAEHASTCRRVALKILGQQLDTPELRQRFLREGRLAAAVNHPNSLYIFGSEEIEDVPVITMEVAGSGTLRDKLRKRGPLPVAEAVDSMLDVIAGLEAASAGGVLHRDVKPSNCFVDPDGSVKIGDFGLSVSTLARDDSYLTATGVIMGTPAYAAPEQLRGDDLDLRADIYSVGATLYTLITGRAPFEGRNAVQVVANAINSKPQPLGEQAQGVPPGLERVVARCLAKEPDGRYSDYMTLRNALLPFSSREPEPASMTARAAAGWPDFLIAFLVPYVILMLAVGNEEFHLRLFLERTLFAARYHLTFLGLGCLYFGIAEGLLGGGLGKHMKGLRVVRTGGGRPGFLRGLVRILIPVLSIELVRLPILLASISATRVDDMSTQEVVIYSATAALCPWIPVLMAWWVTKDSGFATLWDRLSGTRVIVQAKGAEKPSLAAADRLEGLSDGVESIGPYRCTGEVVPGRWIAAADPVLRRPVWLVRRTEGEIPEVRCNLSRSGRLRWLQKLETEEAVWDVYEAAQGLPFSSLVAGGKQLPWKQLRHWLHDLATELWLAAQDGTLPSEISLDHVWISSRGSAVLLDQPWPLVETATDPIPVGTIAGQQRFLHAVAAYAEPTGLPLHARPALQNLEKGKFEKLSFLTGILRGFLDRPAEVSGGIRACALYLMPLYIGIMIFVGAQQGAEWLHEIVGSSPLRIAVSTAVAVWIGSGMVQLLLVPLRTTVGHSTFRLAVLNEQGEPAGRSTLLARWAVAWLPALIPVGLVLWLLDTDGNLAFMIAAGLLLLWLLSTVRAVVHPNRGLHDRLAGTWVVRR